MAKRPHVGGYRRTIDLNKIDTGTHRPNVVPDHMKGCVRREIPDSEIIKHVVEEMKDTIGQIKK